MIPLYIDSCFAWLHPASGGRGVIICPAMGTEELCLHRFVRHLADQLAAAGVPTLRLDYHGTGDSAGGDLDPDRIGHWLASIRAAAEWMRRETGVTEVAMIGLRVGALLAAQAAAELGNVKMLALLAAPASGKFYLREMRALSAFIAQAAAHASVMRVTRPEVEIDVGGFPLSRETAAALERLELSGLPATPAPNVLLLNVPNAPGDKRVAQHLREHGSAVEMAALPGYGELQWNSSLAHLPPDAFDSLVEWLSRDLPPASAQMPARVITRLHGPGWCEKPVHFGVEGKLFGIHCAPVEAPTSHAVLFLNHGSNHHIGWARNFVRLARRFALDNVASLRIDAAGLGDSPAPAGVAENQLYDDRSQHDVTAALDWLTEAGYARVTVVGHCAGAHLGFYSATRDTRVADLVLINLPRFYWNPGDSLANYMRLGFRSNDWYLGKTREANVWRRLLSGQINFRAVARGMSLRFRKRFVSSGRELLSMLLPVADASQKVRQGFRELARRGTRVMLIYSAEDAGLDEIATHAGAYAKRLRRLPGFSLRILEDADHNITAEHAFEAYARLLAHHISHPTNPSGTSVQRQKRFAAKQSTARN